MSTEGHENESQAKGVADEQTPEPETSGEELPRHRLTDVEIDDLVNRAKERDELFDRLQRTVADYENFKRRTRRERAADQERFLVRFVEPFVSVLDDLSLALHSADEAAAQTPLGQGVHMIHQKFLSALEGFRVRPFESQGQPFDPERHEALQQVADPSVPDKTVLQEIRRGYEYETSDGERQVLRVAQVVVSQKPAESTVSEEEK
ncbi:MAG: nucleotide exchange factor GrpE [Planctomycetota bacterium]